MGIWCGVCACCFCFRILFFRSDKKKEEEITKKDKKWKGNVENIKKFRLHSVGYARSRCFFVGWLVLLCVILLLHYRFTKIVKWKRKKNQDEIVVRPALLVFFFLLLSIDFLKSDFVVVRVVALSFPRLILLKRISSAEIRDIFNEPTIYSRIRNRLFSLFSLAFSKLSSKLTVCLLWKK